MSAKNIILGTARRHNKKQRHDRSKAQRQDLYDLHKSYFK